MFVVVVSLTIINDNSLLMIVNIFINDNFLYDCFLKISRLKNDRQSFFIIIRFLKVQNEWVVFKNESFFPKTKQTFLKTILKRNKKLSFNCRFQKRFTTLYVWLRCLYIASWSLQKKRLFLKTLRKLNPLYF